jgi:hypothetical protein
VGSYRELKEEDAEIASNPQPLAFR